MKHYIKYCFFLFFAIGLLASCGKMDETYQGFLTEGERLYTGKPDSLKVLPGNGRVKITWQLGADPKISKVKILWNNRTDSVELPAQRDSEKNKMEYTVDNLTPGIYTFEMYAYDDEGHRSIRSEAIGQVYGSGYASTITNRPVKKAIYRTALDLAYLLWFGASGEAVKVDVRYTDKNDVLRNIEVTKVPNPFNPARSEVWADTTKLPDYKEGTVVKWRTSYLPAANSIDTFLTGWSQTQVENVTLDPNYREPIEYPNVYAIVAKHSGKALVIKTANNSNNTEVVQRTLNLADLSHLWTIKTVNNVQLLTNRFNGAKDMAVASASMDDGAKVIQYTSAANGTNDRWMIEPVDVNNRYYRIVNLKSGKVVTVLNAALGEDAAIQQFTYVGSDNQLFEFRLIP